MGGADPEVIAELMRLHSSAVIPRFKPEPPKEKKPMTERDKGQLVHIFGVVGKDPVVRSTRSGDVIGFSLAYSTGYDKDAPTIWYDVSTFNEGLIASVGTEVYKGARVAVEGFLTHREYEGKSYPQIMAVQVGLIEFLNRTKREGTYVPAGAAAAAPVAVALPPGVVMSPPPAPAAPAPSDDDLPF